MLKVLDDNVEKLLDLMKANQFDVEDIDVAISKALIAVNSKEIHEGSKVIIMQLHFSNLLLKMHLKWKIQLTQSLYHKNC